MASLVQAVKSTALGEAIVGSVSSMLGSSSTDGSSPPSVLVDPTTAGPKPPFILQNPQSHPGSEKDMTPKVRRRPRRTHRSIRIRL